MSTKSVSVLGSTGSIGTQTLQIAAEFPEQFRVVALSAGRNLDLLEQQVRRHRPQAVALAAAELLPNLRRRLADLRPQPELLAGAEGGGGSGGVARSPACGDGDCGLCRTAAHHGGH